MAIKKILPYGDEILRTKSKDVIKISKKIQNLIQDLLDTLYAKNGVGLAAPQIGENLRVFVIDTASGDEPLNPRVFINPKIIKKSGAVNSYEGCLSFPEAYTNVRRYKDVTVKALGMNGRPFVLDAKDGDLLSRAIQHEFDHLEGVLFIDHCRNRMEANKALAQKGLGPVDEEYLLDEEVLEIEISSSPQTNVTE